MGSRGPRPVEAARGWGYNRGHARRVLAKVSCGCKVDPLWWINFIDVEGAKFHPGFEPRPGEIHVTKHRYSPFFGTTLDAILRSRDIRTVIVAGLTADVCVSSTARDAFQREYNVITLSDCAAELTQARHESGLQTLAANFGVVCTSDDVVQRWRSQHTSPALPCHIRIGRVAEDRRACAGDGEQ